MKKTVDECIANKCAPPFYDTYKITVTTGKDMLKLYEHEGMTQDEYPKMRFSIVMQIQLMYLFLIIKRL